LQPTLPTTRIGGWSSGGAGHQGADVGGNGPCRWHESAALRIGASPGLELADGPLVAGLSIQGGSPLAHQVCGRNGCSIVTSSAAVLTRLPWRVGWQAAVPPVTGSE
jgi:hypothetical protein